MSNFRSTRVWARAVAAGAVLALAGLVGGARAAAPPFVAVDLQSGGGDFGFAVALNNEAQVVGTGNLAAGHQPRAFSWTPSGGMVGLGDETDEAVAVNDSGQVVAQRDEFSGLPRAYLWTASDGLVDIGELGAPPPCPTCPHSGPRVSATDMNEAGEIVGISTTAGGEFHAFVWSHAGGMVDLGTLGGTFSTAEAINDLGQVVGESMTAARDSHAFSWTRGGGMVDLGTIGGTSSGAVAVNENGQVVGASSTADGSEHAFSWTQAGGLVDLGTLGGRFSVARAVNDAGLVVGSSTTADGQTHGFAWTAADGMVDLGAEADVPLAVNDHGQVVGFTSHLDAAGVAFSWTQAGGLVELPSLGGPQSEAFAVNDEGAIAGVSYTASGEAHATLWQPRDTTPPELSLPADLRVPATGAGGATVNFRASATDNVDGSVPVSCTPASGSLFPIGDTRVACAATDSSGNTASGGFTVHVEGAAEQLTDLAAAAGAAAGPGASLTRKLAAARAALGRGNLTATCGILHALHNELSGQSETGGTLDADLLRISAVLRC